MPLIAVDKQRFYRDHPLALVVIVKIEVDQCARAMPASADSLLLFPRFRTNWRGGVFVAIDPKATFDGD